MFRSEPLDNEGAAVQPIFLVYTFQDAEHLRELVEALSPYEVIVHVDAKVDLSPFAAAVEHCTNVRMLQDRVQVNWGGYSQVRAIRALVRKGLEFANDDDYLVLLSGSDYPLRAVDELVAHLVEHGGAAVHSRVRDLHERREVPQTGRPTASPRHAFPVDPDRQPSPPQGPQRHHPTHRRPPEHEALPGSP